MKKQRLTITLLHATLTTATLTHDANAATTPASPTIKIGNQTKNTIGTVVDLNQGDIACYLTLKDDAGKQFDESADFELCNKKNIRIAFF